MRNCSKVLISLLLSGAVILGGCLGDASKAKRELGWEPKVRFKELVRIMVESDV
ncbi:MAG: GDP-mannose 4,6-dehydratase, partial [Lachnospiraceae bacterium]|nr:GDP-mannose 4,6-dehydratase [Lachnospiraceae bacterium]